MLGTLALSFVAFSAALMMSYLRGIPPNCAPENGCFPAMATTRFPLLNIRRMGERWLRLGRLCAVGTALADKSNGIVFRCRRL